MARQYARDYHGFAGGVYLFNSPTADQAFNIENMILEPDGKALKRQGCDVHTSIPPLGAKIISLFRWNRATQPAMLLAHADDGKLYYTTDLISWTESGAGAVLSTTNPASFAAGFSEVLGTSAVYLADGVGKPKRWSGTALVDTTATTGIRYLCWWKDTMYGFTTPTNPDRLYASDPGKGDTWNAVTWADMGHGDGDHGTALFSASQEMVACKQNRTYVVVNPTTMENRVADYEKGCESHFSVVKYESEIYYITRLGVARYISGSTAEVVSNNISPLFSPVFLNMNRMDLAHGYRIHHRCGWSLVRSGQVLPDFQIEYYPQYARQPWTFHRMPARAWVTWRDVGEQLYFAQNGTRNLAEAFGIAYHQDFGATFKGTIETLWDDLGDPVNRKYLRAIRLWGEGHLHIQVRRDRRDPVSRPMTASLQLRLPPNWNTDTEDGPDVWSAAEDVWGGSGAQGTDIVYPDYYGRQFSILIYDLPDEPEFIELPTGRRRVGSNAYDYPHGWSLLQMTLEAVQMGELG